MSGMGGGQMYVRNKFLYLCKKGWDVDLIYSTTGKLLIKELQQFNYICPELLFPTYYFTKSRVNSVVHKLASKINDAIYDEIIIESTYIFTSTWGEMVAEMIGAKHIVNLLQEQNDVRNEGLQRFFIYKHQRKELVSITDTSLQQMFASFYPIRREQSYRLPAYCNNVEADVDSPLINQINKEKYDYVIGCLSRLEKPFMIPAIKDFCRYANSVGTKRFLLLIMGGSQNDNTIITQFKNIVTNQTSNVELIITGYIYPVPVRLLDMCDAFFTSAGSAWVCMRSGIPTITYDGNDCRPIGILGRTTNSTLFREEGEPIQDFSDLMDQILVSHVYPKQPAKYQDNVPDFEDHMIFIHKSSQEYDYYCIDNLHIESFAEKKIYLVMRIIGPEKYYHLYQKRMSKQA